MVFGKAALSFWKPSNRSAASTQTVEEVMLSDCVALQTAEFFALYQDGQRLGDTIGAL